MSGTVDYLRLSVTDRCNLRCAYCMPPQGVPWRRHDEILSFEELAAVARAAAACGVSKVRLTGGEPLVRKGCPELVGLLARTSGLHDISLTTNGVLLPAHAAELRRQGLSRVNLSLDSLRPARYAQLSRGGRLTDALAGLESALAAGFVPVKLNVLLLEGIEDELEDFVALTRERPIHVRFIEFMPLDARLAHGFRLVAAPQVLARLRSSCSLVPDEGPYGHGPATYWRAPQAIGTVGFVAGVSSHFCAGCNRLRLTADGRLRGCLFSGEEVDLRPFLGRQEELQDVIRAAMTGKRHDRERETCRNERSMFQIGG